jgi:hypothetical protein
VGDRDTLCRVKSLDVCYLKQGAQPGKPLFSSNLRLRSTALTDGVTVGMGWTSVQNIWQAYPLVFQTIGNGRSPGGALM